MGKSTKPQAHKQLATTTAIAVIAIAATAVSAADSAWLTGEPLKVALAGKIGVTWANIPLRQALERLSESRKVAITLDRRVDPDQKIDLKFSDVPLSEALQRIASRLNIGITMLGPTAYFGPKPTAEKLRTVAALRAEDARKLPMAARQRWMQLKAWKWEPLSAPRELLSQLARGSGIEIEGLQQIPADLWAGGDLPPLVLSDRLSLILSQFDLTYELAADGLSIRLVPMPDKPTIERSYAVTGSPQDVAANLRQQKIIGDAEIRVVGNRVVVRGRQEDQDVAEEMLSGRTARKSTVAEGQKVYTLRIPVEKPVGKVLDELGPALKLEIRVDAKALKAAGLSLDKLVQPDVKEVTADELLRAVLEPAGLTFRRHGDAIDVLPK